MIHTKSLLIGAVLALAGVCAGEGIARAECDYPLTVAGIDPAAYQAYDVAFAMAEESCDLMAHGWVEDGIPEEQVGGWDGMYEACMRLSVPPMFLSPAQHYDTTDGAFWRTVEGEGE